MLSPHTQLTRDSAPDARYKKLLLNSVVCWACALVACYIPALGQNYLVQASSTEFSGSDFKVSLQFQPPPATFGELICDPFVPFLSANVSPVSPKVISSLSLALHLTLLARSVRVRVLLLEFVSTFVSSCTHLSFACFLRLLTFCLVFIELVSSQTCRFRIFSVYPTADLAWCFFAISAITLLFISFVFCRFLFVCLWPSTQSELARLISAIVSYPPICGLYYRFARVSFVLLFFTVDLRLHNSDSRGLRVDEAVLLNSALVAREVCRVQQQTVLESSGLESHSINCDVFN